MGADEPMAGGRVGLDRLLRELAAGPQDTVRAALLPFAGSSRFQLIRRLGAGGFGVVYLVRDVATGTEVALKALPVIRPELIYRLKREFRALADLRHENLIAFYELFASEDQCYLTMEYVPGPDFLSFVRPDGLLNQERLRLALRQLARGLGALHRARKVHRDVKPSNVLVSGERVVILDFGLATEFEESGLGRSAELAGTPEYMAPEHARGGPVSAASDWYSVGVMLYQALTGELPFRGSWAELFDARRRRDPPPPEEKHPGVPPYLSQLCVALLSSTPEKRPTEDQIASALGPDSPSSLREAASDLGAFVGRDAELAVLHEALRRQATGSGVTVRVEGRSGAGKTALVERFLAQASSAEGALVLRGRCYEHEQVPYGGIDSLVDDVSRFLRALPASACEILLPRHLGALLQLFPVLERVPRIAELASRAHDISEDQQEHRRQAFGALRELLARIGDRHHLVIHLDDLQWSDLDTAALLREVLRPPDAPAMLLVLTSREEDRERSPGLQALAKGDIGDVVTIPVGPLSTESSVALARLLLGGEATWDLGRLASEAGGSPFFIHELARYARGATPSSAFIDLASALKSRIGQLPVAAARLLEVVSLAGLPIPEIVARRAAGVSGSPWEAWAPLDAGRFVRFFGSPECRMVEPFHDRIRETVVAAVDEGGAAVSLHRALAQAMGEADGIDPEVLARHHAAAGMQERARELVLMAAAQAEKALAFDRAARLFLWALDLGPGPSPGRRAVLTSLAGALANAGRGVEAARAYLGAAEGADPAVRTDLRRRASEQLLFSGRIDEGRALVNEELHAAGYGFAATPARALVSLLGNRLWLRLRGLGFRERAAREIAPDRLALFDHLWSVARGVSLVDIVRSAELGARLLRLGLEMGEPARVAEALVLYAGHAAAESPYAARTEKAMLRLDALVNRLEDRHLSGYPAIVRGIRSFMGASFDTALTESDQAERIFRESGGGLAWEIWTARMFAAWALFYLGRWGELDRRVALQVEEARERGNVYAFALTVTPWGMVPRLAQGDSATAARWIQSAATTWSVTEFQLEHYWFLTAGCLLELVAGRGAAAWQRLQRGWPGLAGSLTLRLPLVRTQMLHLRGACAIAAASLLPAGNHERNSLLIDARRSVRHLRRTPLSAAPPLAGLLAAALAVQEGRHREVEGLLEAAIRDLDRSEMSAYSAAARRQLSRIAGRRPPDPFMPGEVVTEPDAIAGMLAPGFGT